MCKPIGFVLFIFVLFFFTSFITYIAAKLPLTPLWNLIIKIIACAINGT